MHYHYEWLRQPRHSYLMVASEGKLVFVGGPHDSLATAKELLGLSERDVITAGGVPALISEQLRAMFMGTRQAMDPLLYHSVGTAFRNRVYAALLEIPYGQTRTYSEVAAAIGQPAAYRAVAHAVATNPLLVVQPCHRVVPKRGGVGQFRGGSAMKHALLDLEAGKRVQL